MRRILRGIVHGALLGLAAAAAAAQQLPVTPPAAPPITPAVPAQPVESRTADVQERIGENRLRFIGHFEYELGDLKIYADQAEYLTDEDRFVATGNVVLSQATNRIAADRADFNTKTRLGTFYNAFGLATIQPQKQTIRPGAPPPIAGQDGDVYFFGETVEKVGPKKYKITNGGFSTCVQPTPRWQLTSSTVVLNMEHYTVLRSAVLSVKGVPMLYLPFLYYPTKKEDRATGFLLPTYGSSTLRGQSVHNAFFWAVDRSQDATFAYDWFSNAGQGVGGEYRYNFGLGSDGNIRVHVLDQGETTFLQPDGTANTLPAERSFEIRGGGNQLLPGGFRARARVDYFSSITSMQTFNTNLYDASRNQRSFGGNVTGLFNGFSLNGTFDHSEYFYYGQTDSSAVSGSWPRITLSRNERPLFGSPVYFSVTTDYASLLNDRKAGAVDIDSGLTRLDLLPQIRYPFKKWQWLTANSSVTWRDTYYTRSYNAKSLIVDEPVNRRFFEFQTQIVGPVFTRVWNTPANGYAEKFKHTVEPFLTMGRTTSVDDFDRIVVFDGVDQIVGDTTRFGYGLTNRFYAKRRPKAGLVSQAREIVDVELTQTYYTDSRAAQLDRQYTSSTLIVAANPTVPPSNFSPIALSVRILPTDELNVTARAEFDSRYHSLRTISASGTYTVTNRLSATASWSKRAFIKELAGFNDPTYLDQSITTATTVHTRDNRFGGVYSFNYDVFRSRILQQRLTGFYNAQCCGISFEYQTFNLGGVGAYADLNVPADRRFFMSFTLAGLGNFSPFNGALSGVPR